MLRQGMWVRMIGEWGTPSQKAAIWVVDDRYPGPWVEIRRLDDPDARTALDYVRDEFLRHDATGPMRVASFLHGRPDDATQADVVAFMKALVDACV